jgi:DNA polymerase-1
MVARDQNIELLRVLFNELEFTTLLAEVSTQMTVGETKYRQAASAADVDAELKYAKQTGSLAVAIEFASAAGLDAEEEARLEEESDALPLIPPSLAAGTVVPAGKLAISGAPASALSANFDDGPTATSITAALADASLPKAIHDYKSAIRLLEPRGIAVAGVKHDPALYSYLLNPTYSTHALDEVALRTFNVNLSGDLAEAADITGRMASALRQQVEEAGLTEVYETIDLPLVSVLAGMEEAGVKIDREVLQEMSVRLDKECDAKAREIHHLAGTEFNINSPKQLGDVLFNKLALPKPVKYGKGKTVSTAVEVLEELAAEHEVPRRVLEYRQLSKLKSTYVDALPQLLSRETNRLHTTFNQTGTATGRLSSTNPNLQNIPIRTELGREIRAAFIAEKGNVLMASDYSQIELRLLAHLSQDPLLVEAFNRGDDIHTLTASQVFAVPPLMVNAEHRRRAKVINFGIVYGLSAFGLSQQLGIEQREAKEFIDAYFTKYAGVRKFIDKTLDEARRDQRVKTLFGRIRPIPDIHSKNYNMRGFAERTAVNTPLQGTAADLIKLAMIRLDAEIPKRKLKSRMTLQVHDELVFEVPGSEIDTLRELVREQMQNVYKLRVPLLVDIGVGKNWRDLEY